MNLSDPPSLLIILGAVLVAIGLLGGGIEVMAAKIPALTSRTRLMVVIGGTLLLAVGVTLYVTDTNSDQTDTGDAPQQQQ